MSLTMYQASVPVFTRALTNLSVVLGKAEDHWATRDRPRTANPSLPT